MAQQSELSARLQELDTERPVAGIPGPGSWLVAEFAPAALFSLKTSQATSSVGRTLVMPTPYAIKMACVDAAFRTGWPDNVCATFLESLAGVDVRIRPPAAAVVTHTIVKIRQEPKRASPGQPYISNIAYREVVHHAGSWLWAFDLAAGDETLAERLAQALPRVRYVGKRGSFVQFLGLTRRTVLGTEFSAAIEPGADFQVPPAWHLQPLDDFGPGATFDALSTYSSARAVRGRDRVFRTTVIPLGLMSTGPGFSEYRDRF
jgi:hypothetical protein